MYLSQICMSMAHPHPQLPVESSSQLAEEAQRKGVVVVQKGSAEGGSEVLHRLESISSPRNLFVEQEASEYLHLDDVHSKLAGAGCQRSNLDGAPGDSLRTLVMVD